MNTFKNISFSSFRKGVWQLLLLLIIAQLGFAQNNYPVVISPMVKPTFSLQWHDYTTSLDLLRVSIILRDQNKDNLDIYLNLKFIGPGWTIQTNPAYQPDKKIRLVRGQTLSLTGVDLADYLRYDHVLVDGLPPDLIRNGGTLPEGFCTLEVYAYEDFRDRVVSNVGFTNFSIFEAKPPLLLSPANEATLRAIYPQRLMLQWQPQNAAVWSTNGPIAYRVKIVEVPPNVQPNDAISSINSPAIYLTTAANSAIIGPDASMIFEKGKQYAWQVEIDPTSYNTAIINQGKSEVWTFRWGGECTPPTGLQVLANQNGGYRISWDEAATADQYVLRYRAIGSTTWTDSITTYAAGWSLLSATPIEASVACICGNTTGSYSSTTQPTINATSTAKTSATNTQTATSSSTTTNTTTTATTLPLGNVIIQVDENGNPISYTPPTAQQLLDMLQTIPPPKCAANIDQSADCKNEPQTPTYSGEAQNDIKVGSALVINRYKVIVTNISSANGNTYSGEGVAYWPYLGSSALVPVQIQNCTVVKDAQDQEGGCVVAGKIVAGQEGMLSRDANNRLQTLYAFMANPTYFTADLKRAAEALAKKADELSKASAPTAADYKYYKTYAAATKAGLQAWKAEIESNLGTPLPEAVSQIIANIDAEIARLTAQITAADALIANPQPVANSPLAASMATDIAFPAKVEQWQQLMTAYLKPNRSQMSQLDFANGRVTFANSSSHLYGYDSYLPQRGSVEADYVNLGSGYMVDYVSVKASETTQLKANFLPNNAPIDPQFTAANIKFRNSKGEELAATYTAPTWAITLPAAGAGEDEVFAFWTPPSGTPKSVGKLLVKRYEEKTKKLQIVRVGSVAPVDGNAIAAALNDIYKPALTKWEVSVVSKDIKFDYKDGVMNAEGLASFSNYSAEMKELITTYFGGNRVDDPNTYYLFVVPGFTPSNVQGYMPRGRNVGFVSDVSARNMAHELGHGAFGLRHTFDEQPESKSNLLDYGSESYLTAAQWQQIQNPPLIINWFDDMEDAMSQTVIAYALCIENTSAFKGKVFNIYQEGNKKLKANTEPYAFTVDGQLYSFKVDGKIYVPYKNYSGHWGYALKGISPTESDKYTFEVANGAVAVNVQIQQQPSVTTLRLDATVYTPSTCFEVIDVNWLSEAGRAKLSSQLKALGATNTEITIKECGKPTAHTVTAVSTTATQGQKDIQIELCWDGKIFKISSHSFKAGALQIPTGYTGTPADVESKSNAAVDRVKESGIAATQSDDGELTYKSLSFIEAVVAVKEATITLCNQAKVPEKFWDDKHGDYPNSPFHGPTLSGVGDGAISELKDIPELVGFGLEIATEPDKAKATWNGIKSMTPTKVKKMLLGAAADKIAKYTAGGNTMKHEAGKDGVQLAMFVVGAVKSIGTNAAKIASLEGDVVNKLDEITDETLDATSNAVEEITGKEINKALKEGNTDGIPVDPAVIENTAIDVTATSVTKGRKLTWPELKALWKRGNDFNTKVRNLVPNPYQYYEVTVEKVIKTLPDGTEVKKRFRLDSYNPGAEIVSRKATTFDEISTVTFQNYLDELTRKYANGLKIIKPGTPIDGQTLSGVYKLEVPLINQTSSKLTEFTNLASAKGITIIFKAE